MNLASLLYWLGSSFLLRERKRFIQRQLCMAAMDFQPSQHKDDLTTFARRWIKIDGVFVLRIITMHSGLTFSSELLLNMWNAFQEHQRKAIALVDKANDETRLNIDGPDSPGPAHSKDDQEENWDISSLPPRPQSPVTPVRKTSVFVPILLPHKDRTHLPPPPSYYKRASFGTKRANTVRR